MHYKLTVSSDRRWKWIHLKSSVQVALVMNFYKQVNFQDQSKGWITHLCWVGNFLQHKDGLEYLKLVFVWRRKCAIEFLKQPILCHCFAHFHESSWKFPNFHSPVKLYHHMAKCTEVKRWTVTIKHWSQTLKISWSLRN